MEVTTLNVILTIWLIPSIMGMLTIACLVAIDKLQKQKPKPRKFMRQLVLSTLFWPLCIVIGAIYGLGLTAQALFTKEEE